MPSLLSTLKSNTVQAGQNLLSSTAKSPLSSVGLKVPFGSVNVFRSSPATSNTILAETTNAKGRIVPWADDSSGADWAPSSKRTQAVPDDMMGTHQDLQARGFNARQSAAIISTAKLNAKNLGTSVNTEINAIMDILANKGWMPGGQGGGSSPSTDSTGDKTSDGFPTTYLAIGGVAVLALLLLRK